MRRHTRYTALPSLISLLSLLLVLSGCASTIRSEVTAFHQWPAATQNSNFAFELTPAQKESLEQQSYQSLIREHLLALGLHAADEADQPAAAQLKVTFSTSISGRDVRIVETVLVDPWYGSPWYGPGFYAPYWSPYSGYPGYGYPFYGPGWGPMPVPREQERRYTVFHRELSIVITDARVQKPVYEVTVRSDGKEGNLAKVMPYLVKSAFSEFPGKSGVPRVIELKMKE